MGDLSLARGPVSVGHYPAAGAGAVRHVEGVWPRKDASTNLPRQIIAVAGL